MFVITKNGLYYSALTNDWVPELERAWWFYSIRVASKIANRIGAFAQGASIVEVRK